VPLCLWYLTPLPSGRKYCTVVDVVNSLGDCKRRNMLIRLQHYKENDDVIMIHNEVVKRGGGEVHVTDEDLQANRNGGTNLYSKELVERMTKK
jgi:hypothetical protein